MKNLTKTHLSCPALVMQAIATLVRFKSSQPAALLLLLFIFIISACNSQLSDFENRQISAALGDSLFTVTESWGFEMEIIEDGVVHLKLQGSYAASINNEHQNETRIGGPVHILIFDDEGEIDTEVHADSAVHLPENSEFEMYGNVHVQAPEGKRLMSDYLKWERSRDRVSTQQFVIFISPPDSIAANGFFGNTDLTNYTLNEGGGRITID